MKIANIKATNFKSFKEIDIPIDNFTLIVGANAAGKSNLMSIFKFIRDIANEGLTNAVDMQGGIDYLCNANSPKGTPIFISFTMEIDNRSWWGRSNNNTMVAIKKINYAFEITPNIKGQKYSVSYDELNIEYEIAKHVKDETNKKRKIETIQADCKTQIIKKSKQSKYEIVDNLSSNSELKKEEGLFPLPIRYFLSNNPIRTFLLLMHIDYLLPPIFSNEHFISIFDFDPWHLKRPCQVTSKKILDENGSNLASVLQVILSNKENKQKFLTLLKNVLPFVDKMKVDKNYDQSYSYKITETYSNKAFYSNFLSDGTVSVIATIIALYFDNRTDIVIIEEPERNIHPKLLSKIVEMAEDVSAKKQVIFTTHNPEILGNSKIENIRFIQRSSEGYSKVTIPANSLKVKKFIENELTIGDLFTQNLLGD